jgi:histidine triad (HIT) family protein
MSKEAKPDFYCDEILSGNVPIDVAYETERVLAYHHSKSPHAAHIIVIPKRHIVDITTLDDPNLAAEIDSAVRSMAAKVLSEYGIGRVYTNLGMNQHNEHLHWHITTESR